MCRSLAANHFVYVYFYLALVAQCAQCVTQCPILCFLFGTIEVLGCTSQHALINRSLSLSCDAYEIAASNTQLIYDMIAIDSLFTGCVFCVHTSIIRSFGYSVNQKDPIPTMAVGFPKCGILATEWANLVFANRNVKALWQLLPRCCAAECCCNVNSSSMVRRPGIEPGLIA